MWTGTRRVPGNLPGFTARENPEGESEVRDFHRMENQLSRAFRLPERTVLRQSFCWKKAKKIPNVNASLKQGECQNNESQCRPSADPPVRQ